MRLKLFLMVLCLNVFMVVSLFGQTHTTVPLESNIYYILEQAETKGLCAPLSGIRPYTQNVVLAVIAEILSSEKSGKLSAVERAVLEEYTAKFSKQKKGIDWQQGAYYNETTIGSSGVPLTFRLGATADIQGSIGIYPSFEKRYWGTETWVGLTASGDLGSHVSWVLGAEGGLTKAPRIYLGKYNTYYDGFVNVAGSEFQNDLIDTYSEPLTHFPYSYRKRWDGSVRFLNNLNGHGGWPDEIAGAYGLKSELTAAFLENKLIARLGRITHDWASSPLGTSLALNQSARPFLALEAEFNPFSWLSIASITGVLEYYNGSSIKDSAERSQNVFSAGMIQLRYKNYVYLDISDEVVWPKRFELGYISPITEKFFYQDNIGDFDNLALNATLKLQYPGIGSLWFSLFVDEMSFERQMFELDRTMTAEQAGMTFSLPILAFSSLKLSYTVINPYNYTHNRNFNPWYGNIPMETSYTNNGVGLGYYLPPNSDEVLVQFKTMPVKNLITHLQYQMIRHGADFGPDAVDGSSYLSELDPDGRSTNPILRRYFLHDGAYQWMHIIKIGAEWTLPKTPVALYGEAGTVISYFTDIETGKANSGESYPYQIIDTPDYPKSIGFVVTVGFKLFPR